MCSALAIGASITVPIVLVTRASAAEGTELGWVTVYGAKWCGPCHVLQDGLKERGVPYDYVDIDESPVAWQMARKASGSNGIPTTSIKRGPTISWVIGSDVNAVEKAYRGD
jgi:mycoredoxin